MLSLAIAAAFLQDPAPAPAPEPAPPAVDLSGRVVDPRGRPAREVRIVLGEVGHAILTYASPNQTHVATPGFTGVAAQRFSAELSTDQDGRFHAEGLVAGEYSAVATDGEGAVALATFAVGAGAPSPIIALREPAFLEAEITGIERDPTRHVLHLKALQAGSNLTIVPRLEERGKSWSFRSVALPSVPSWQIVGTEFVLGHDYPAVLFSLPVTLAPGEKRRLVVDLSRGCVAEGRVADAEGRALAGVSVVARRASAASEERGAVSEERGAVSDASGRYAIRGLREGAYEFEAARWAPRDTPGCGPGFQDLFRTKAIVLPLEDPSQADFAIESSIATPKVGDEAPLFEAQTVDGRRLELRALRGKVVLLDFWATWCPLCRAEMPALVERYAQWSKDGKFEIVGISIDEDVGVVPRFAASRGLRWPQVALGPTARNPLARLYNVHSTPTTVLVDKQGRIAAVNAIGERLRRKVEELIEAK